MSDARAEHRRAARAARAGGKIASRLAEQPPADTFQQRVGRCYELAWKYVFDSDDDRVMLVHGFIGGPHAATNRIGAPKIGHAWAVTADGLIYDPTHAKTFSRDEFHRDFAGQPYVVYSRKEMLAASLLHDSYGPWDADYDAVEEVYRAAHRLWELTSGWRRSSHEESSSETSM